MEEEIYQLMAQFLERQELINQIHHSEKLSGYGTAELHVLKAINEIQDPNVTELAKALRLTKGAISKTVRKLQAKKLVESYKKEGNRQKVYYRMTSLGGEIYERHEIRDDVWKQKNHEFLTRLTPEEMQNATRYMRLYNDFLEQVIKQEAG